jgi:hypothetical protein
LPCDCAESLYTWPSWSQEKLWRWVHDHALRGIHAAVTRRPSCVQPELRASARRDDTARVIAERRRCCVRSSRRERGFSSVDSRGAGIMTAIAANERRFVSVSRP